MKHHPVIALLTDFGVHDGYVGAMKGTILSLSPSAIVIDITHIISPQNIDEAAFMLWCAFPYFPPGTIFVCVVDPGVGTNRNIICVQTSEYYFLVPDNGILKFVLNTVKPKSIINITNKKYWRREASRTFHGRDIFAPVSAHLSLGVPVSKFGKATKLSTTKEDFVRVSNKKKEVYDGKVLHVDRFGNIITNFFISIMPSFPLRVHIGKKAITNFSGTYADAKPKSAFIIRGSTKLIEISLKNGNAAELLDVHVNRRLKLHVG